jgi:hypothetical protein
MSTFKCFILTVFTCLLGIAVQAQSTDIGGYAIKPDRKFATHQGNINAFKKHRYFRAGGGFHLMNYVGDLSPSDKIIPTDLKMTRPGLSVWMSYKWSPRTSVRVDLLMGRLMGDDFQSFDLEDSGGSSLFIRNLSFRNDIIEFSTTFQFDLFRDFQPFFKRRVFNLYILGGAAVFYHNPKGKVPEFGTDNVRFSNYGQWVALRPLGTEGQNSPHYNVSAYNPVQLAIPFGGGFSMKIGERTDLNFEINYRILFTDFIDDVSGRYVDLGALDSELAKAMSDRSTEKTAIIDESRRPLSEIIETTGTYTYPSQYDGRVYTVLKGYGSEGGTRGGSNNDVYLSTSLKLSYILGPGKKHGW